MIEPITLDHSARRDNAKLVVARLAKSFGNGNTAVQAISPIDLYVGKGDFLCVVGPRELGCGRENPSFLKAHGRSVSAGIKPARHLQTTA